MKLVASVLVTALTFLTSAVAVAQNTVKIGVISDLSGPYTAMSGKGSQAAAELAVEDIGGTVLGKKIEILTGDSQNRTEVGATIARRWFEAEGVSMITDNFGSAVGLAVHAEARRADRIAMFSGSFSTDLVGKDCSANSFLWTIDHSIMPATIAKGLVEEGLDSWYFLTMDQVFGRQSEAVATEVVKKMGGKVLGSALFPVTNTDFSTLLLGAQASKAKVIVMTGGDISSAMKQATEFGILQGGQRLASTLLFISFAKAIGPKQGQGFYSVNTFYWDLNERTRTFAKRFHDKVGIMPDMTQAGTYSSTLHYLKAVKAAGTTDTAAVTDMIRKLPVDDDTVQGNVRADGRLVRDYYIWRMKGPAESKGEWDLFAPVRKVSGAEIVPPLSESQCPLVKK